MVKVRHINCPACGGTLGTGAMDRVVECRYCGTKALVEFPDFVPEYYVKPRVNEIAARRKVQAFLRDPDLPQGMLKKAKLYSAKLYFIPYNELQGRRLGSVTTTTMKHSGPRVLTKEYMGTDLHGRAKYAWKREATGELEEKKETRIVLADFERLSPAVQLPQWGLEAADIKKVRSEAAGLLRPMNRKALERTGRVFDPADRPEDLMSFLEFQAETSAFQDHTEFTELRPKRIYYPIWRVRYQYQGRLYGVSVDGVTGKILAARAPQNDKFRIYWILGTASLSGFLAGKGLRPLFGALWDFLLPAAMHHQLHSTAARFTEFYLITLILLFMLAVFFFSAGWVQFRYPGEVVVEGDERKVEKIMPSEATTLFDRILKILGEILEEIVKGAERRRRR